jgi:hypothetical protein
MPTISLGFDADSIARMKAIAGWEVVFRGQLFIAMQDSLDALELAAQGIMQSEFKNPTGVLAGNFDKSIPVSNAEETVGMLSNDSPYAWRRDRGFVGMTDSLGRHYNDEGIEYMEKALAQKQSSIERYFVTAVSNSIGMLTGGGL